jgi:flagellar motor protein MotB
MGHDPEGIQPYVEDKTPLNPAPAKAEIPEPPQPKAEGDIDVAKTAEGTQYTIVGQAVLFKPGSAELTDAGREVVGRVAEMIKKDYANNEIVVQGLIPTASPSSTRSGKATGNWGARARSRWCITWWIRRVSRPTRWPR